jgi:uncharacterized protein
MIVEHAPHTYRCGRVLFAASVATVLLSGCVLRRPLTNTFGFQPKPMRSERATPAEWGWPDAHLDTISRFDSAGGLLAWWAPASGTGTPCAGVLMLHGKGKNRAELLPLGRSLQAAGYSVLVPDYRGYGGTVGEPTTPGVFADAELAYRDLRSRLGDSTTPVVILGHSMGTALAARLSRDHAPVATVYMSPFTRIASVVRSRAGAIGPRLFDTTMFAFNPLEDASQARTRALVVVAGRDLLISRKESNAFIAGLSPAPVVLRDRKASHNGLLSSRKTVRAVTDSISAWVPCSGGRNAGGGL